MSVISSQVLDVVKLERRPNFSNEELNFTSTGKIITLYYTPTNSNAFVDIYANSGRVLLTQKVNQAGVTEINISNLIGINFVAVVLDGQDLIRFNPAA